MICIVTGSRSITDYSVVTKAFDECGFKHITWLFSGHNLGTLINGVLVPNVDLLAERWAKEHSIPIKTFPANWNLYNKQAGPVRNTRMVTTAKRIDPQSYCLAIWDGVSRGTKDCYDKAVKAGLQTFLYDIRRYQKPIRTEWLEEIDF